MKFKNYLYFYCFLFLSCSTPQTIIEPDFQPLFNGNNLDGWVGNKQSYTVDKGTILIDPKGKGGGNLYTQKEYSNFILRFEFQLTPGANNGLGIHTSLEGDAAYLGKELQILDNSAEKYAKLKAYQYHGSVYGVIPAKRGFQKPVEEWNQQEVQVNGSKIKVILNGTTIVDGDYLVASKNGTVDGKQHPGLFRNKGHIGFLGHGDVLRFRNIRIKDLGDKPRFEESLLTTTINDQFPQSTPESEGIASEYIQQFVQTLEEEIDAVHSFMLLKNGKQIAEGWWDPYDSETPHVMHSLSKSFTSTAIGFAAQEGLVSLDDPIIQFFPDKTPKKPSWQLKSMRIRDLLTMNTGHIEEPTVWFSDGDWAKFFLEQEIPLTPGTHFKYNSPATYMLSAIIQKVSGEKLVNFLNPRLFEPLGIDQPQWDECPQSINTGGWGLHIKTEDIAKLGQLYLQKGVWNGKRLLTEDWVNMATSKQTSNGSDPNNDWNQGYGFQFWRCRYDNYRGDGAFGQYCIVMPKHNAVLAITSGVNDMAAVMNVVWEKLLPALESERLPMDKPGQEALKSKTATLKLPAIMGKKTSPFSQDINNRTFQFTTNSGNLKSAIFNLDGDQHQLILEMNHGEEIIPIGVGKYDKSELKTALPYTNNLMKKIAASGAWQTENTYQLRVYLYEMPARITYTFQFKNDTVNWTSKLEHSLLGMRKTPELQGKTQ